ncbi:DUF5597 domain-containing protein [Paenibacillus sp. R14(2021)]|uniref:DUF5597 domain-containing protein n=1 Tax=Paenibacillus sp. R14(2021) TaxID=2859228 RepID=UPI0021584068|nr:DUF5597 domain-containing protein [Paenibacillus sp. R14(2021)]
MGAHEFYLAGFGYSAVFLPKRGERGKVGVVRIEEGGFDGETWRRRRVLNGDEGAYGVYLRADPEVLRVEIYRYV